MYRVNLIVCIAWFGTEDEGLEGYEELYCEKSTGNC